MFSQVDLPENKMQDCSGQADNQKGQPYESTLSLSLYRILLQSLQSQVKRDKQEST